MTVEYPLHPLFGRKFSIERQFRFANRLFLEIAVDGKRVLIPEWMTRQNDCGRLRCGLDPVCSWNALRRIRKLIDQQQDL